MYFKTPKELLEAALTDAANKVKISHKSRIILAIVAGIQVALAGVGASITSFDLPYVGLQKLVFGLVFTAGLVMIVFSGTDLFTGNTTIMIGVNDKKVTVWEYIRTMLLTLTFNIVGGVGTAWLISLTNLWGTAGGKYGAYAIQVAINKTSMGFTSALVMGIFCNFLVCTAIWICRASNDGAGKCISMMLPVGLFAAVGFEHSVANAYIIPAGIFAKANEMAVSAFANPAALDSLTWKGFFVDNMIPVVIGNWIGGAILTALLLYWAYIDKVKADRNNG